jgi:DNA-binding transcriptional LysR family regulator
MVSKRLARLEARLGATLITRTTRRIALTEAGSRFHADVVAILAAVEDAETRVSGQSGRAAGPLRVSAPTSFGRMHIAPYLKPFLDAHPHIALELNLSDGFIDLMGERTDLAIRITPEVGPGLDARRLGTSQRILCAAPGYIADRGAPESIEALSRHRLLASVGQLPWRLTGQNGASAQIEGRSHVGTNSSEVVRELAVAGVGIALRSLWDISRDLAEGRLLRVLPEWEGSADVGIYAVSPRRQWPLAGADAFAAFLEGLYSPVPPWES